MTGTGLPSGADVQARAKKSQKERKKDRKCANEPTPSSSSTSCPSIPGVHPMVRRFGLGLAAAASIAVTAYCVWPAGDRTVSDREYEKVLEEKRRRQRRAAGNRRELRDMHSNRTGSAEAPLQLGEVRKMKGRGTQQASLSPTAAGGAEEECASDPGAESFVELYGSSAPTVLLNRSQ